MTELLAKNEPLYNLNHMESMVVMYLVLGATLLKETNSILKEIAAKLGK